MTTRDRTADLDTLADAVMAGVTHEESELCFTEDVRYRLADSVLELIGATEEGFEQYWDHYDRWFTGDQEAYALSLWDDVAAHIKARWAAFREAERA